MPEPQFNARLYAGRELVAVADAWWEEAGVVAEVDSRAYHYSVEDWQRTMRRHDRLVGQVRAALAAGHGRAPLAITGRRR